MSELQQYYDAFRTGYWADPDPQRCRCRGSGWALSEVDTWHECPIHYRKGQRHPEDYDGEDYSLDPCPECGDGANYPPIDCPKCGESIKRVMHEDDLPTPLEDDESHLPHSEEDTRRRQERDDDIPF